MSTTKVTLINETMLCRTLDEGHKGNRKNYSGPKMNPFRAIHDPHTPIAMPPQLKSPNQIRALRQKLKLTQKEFAALLGIHSDTVKKYESESPKTNRVPCRSCLRLMELLERNPSLATSCREVMFFTSTAIGKLRVRYMCASQSVFANWLGVTTDALRTWEQNTKRPNSTAARLLQIAMDFPEVLVPEERKPTIEVKLKEAESVEQNLLPYTGCLPGF